MSCKLDSKPWFTQYGPDHKVIERRFLTPRIVIHNEDLQELLRRECGDAQFSISKKISDDSAFLLAEIEKRIIAGTVETSWMELLKVRS